MGDEAIIAFKHLMDLINECTRRLTELISSEQFEVAMQSATRLVHKWIEGHYTYELIWSSLDPSNPIRSAASERYLETRKSLVEQLYRLTDNRHPEEYRHNALELAVTVELSNASLS